MPKGGSSSGGSKSFSGGGSSSKGSSGGSSAVYFKSDGSIDGRCSAARQGLAWNTSAGTVDQRCSAVVNGLLHVNNDGMASASSSLCKGPILKSSPQISFSRGENGEYSVTKNSQAVNDGYLRFNKDMTVDKTCSACKNGDVLVRGDGTIDGRSSLIKTGTQHYSNDEVTAGHLRISQAQAEHRNQYIENGGHQANSKDVDHIVPLDYYAKILNTKPGPGITQAGLDGVKEVANGKDNLRMIKAENNRGDKKCQDNKILDAIQNKDYSDLNQADVKALERKTNIVMAQSSSQPSNGTLQHMAETMQTALKGAQAQHERVE